MEFVQILVYACTALFIAAVVWRVVRYSTTPIHLRWELYPVAHEKGRAEYGGSIFEEMEWWNKPRQVDRLNELKEMLLEILFMKGVYLHNRPLWIFSFPFHFGLYMLVGWLAMVILMSILLAAGVPLEGGAGGILRFPITVLGYGGLCLTTAGAAGLLFRRMSNPEIRRYSAPVEFLNLAFFIVALVVALVAHTTSDPAFMGLIGYLAQVVSFQEAAAPTGMMRLEVVLGALLMAYIPLTRMAHFVSKYFLYHEVRWNDEPNTRGGAIEREIKKAFAFRMDWEGPHIQTGKSWAEVGTEIIDGEEEK